jgi:hypothetical protein
LSLQLRKKFCRDIALVCRLWMYSDFLLFCSLILNFRFRFRFRFLLNRIFVLFYFLSIIPHDYFLLCLMC